jgi:hypothetical protein
MDDVFVVCCPVSLSTALRTRTHEVRVHAKCSTSTADQLKNLQHAPKYCDVLPVNASVTSGFWILCLDLLVIHQAELQLTYYSRNLTVITLEMFTS